MYYYHSPEFKNGVRVTIAGIYNNGVLVLSAARCSHKDQFNKKIGRKIASGRMYNDQIVLIKKIENFVIKNFIKEASSISLLVKNGIFY